MWKSRELIAPVRQSSPEILTATVRKALPRDFPFIFDTFAESVKSFGTGAVAKQQNAHSAKWLLRSQMTQLQEEKRAVFYVACDPEDSDLLLGWCCLNNPFLHYVYVKQIYRRQGIMTTLLAPLASEHVVYVTFWTKYMNLINKPLFRSVF